MTRIKLSGVVLALGFTGAVCAQGAPVVNVGGTQSSESASQRLDRLERLLEARMQGQTAMMEQLGRLQRELSELRGMTEEHAFQLDQIVQRQRDIYQELDRLSQQIRSGGAGSGSGGGSAGADSGSGAGSLAGGSGAGGSGSVPTLPVQISDNVSENQAYDRAVRLVLQDRRYDQAIPEFQAFLQAYPNSSYAGNAHYWLGQLFYAQENYDEAVPHFQRVVNDFRDSNKRADCILKLGMIAQARGNAGEARRLFEQVRSEYAGSTEAGMAARQLEQLR